MSLEIESLVVGEMGTNCHLVWDTEDEAGLVIDPGAEGDFISQKIIELGFKPLGIILTHGHFDHCLGLLEVKLNFKVPIYLNKADLSLYKNAGSSAKRWLGVDSGPLPQVDEDLKDGQKINFGSQTFTVMGTPGHTPGSVSLTNNISMLITGDTLFKGGIGRADFSYSDPELLKSSLKRIFELPGWCKVYSGHGEVTTIGEESLNFPG
jgi:glyoxylase-like metal-dependent hydrolase (beta-lactamase superfamily II)